MALEDPQYGQNWTPGDHVQSILRAEAAAGQNVPEHMLRHDYRHLGSEDIAADRYFSPEFHRLEVERMWGKVWQIACRLEDLPKVGSHYRYDIAHHSLLVVRVNDTEVKAYHNSCLHRGTMLRTAATGVGPTIRCPFHGWTWNLNGTIKTIPGNWDFQHVANDPKKTCLPEAKVETWGGFVFINLDKNAGPLSDFLEVVPEHFAQAGWKLENAVKVAHVAAVVNANWKIFIESVQESYHGPCTHPQLTPYYSGGDSQYDVYGDHTDRHLALNAVPHPALRETLGEQAIAEAMVSDMGFDGLDIELSEGQTARGYMTEVARAAVSGASGLGLSQEATASLLDNIAYSLFPSVSLCGGYNYPVVARSRPHGNDPTRCVVEVYILAHLAPDAPRPEPAKINWIDPSDWTAAPELGVMGRIFNQDVGNMERMQKGLEASAKGAVTLANYMEVRIRHLHQTIDRYIAEGP